MGDAKKNWITVTESRYPWERDAPDFVRDLRDTAAFGVCLRDLEAAPGRAERPGVLAAVRGRNCPGLPPKYAAVVDRPLGKVIAQAIEQAGIPSGSRKRRVSDYQ